MGEQSLHAKRDEKLDFATPCWYQSAPVCLPLDGWSAPLSVITCVLNSRQNKRWRVCGQSLHSRHSSAGHLLFPLIVSWCLFSITRWTLAVMLLRFGGMGHAGRGHGSVGVMKCRPGAVKLQIDAGVLINARAHPPRLAEAWQFYW